MKSILALSVLLLAHELSRFGVIGGMNGKFASLYEQDEAVLVWLWALVLAVVFSAGQHLRKLRKVAKLGILAFIAYRAYILQSGATPSGWNSSSQSGKPLAFEASILMRLIAVLVQIPDAVATVPSIVDADLAWLISCLPSGATSALTSGRSHLRTFLEACIAAVPWHRLLFTLFDVAGAMLFFKLTRLTIRIATGVPGAMSPGAWISYIKANGYSFVKDLPMVKKEIAKEQAKLEKDLDAELKTRSRGIVMIRDHEQMHNNPRSRHTPGADMLSPSASKKKRTTTDEEEEDKNCDAMEANLNRTLPRTGRHASDLLALMRRETKKENTMWQEGKVSGAVYHGTLPPFRG